MTTEHEKMLITKYDLLFESRLSKVETTIDNLDKRMDSFDRRMDSMDKHMSDGFRDIRTDLRWMLGIMLGFSGILMGLMAKGFHWFV